MRLLYPYRDMGAYYLNVARLWRGYAASHLSPGIDQAQAKEWARKNIERARLSRRPVLPRDGIVPSSIQRG